VTWPILLLALWLAIVALWLSLALGERELRRARERAAEMRRHPSSGGRLGGEGE
jgi:hypothetical protein